MTLRHVLFTSTPGWGHIRPFCILAARLVNQHQDVAFTMILAPQTLKKAADEISVELRESDSEEARKRIRVLSSIPDASIQPLEGIKQMAESYSNVYSLLVAGKSVTCAATGTVFEPLPPPKVVVLDFFAVAQYLATREISGNTIPIMAWLTGHAPSLIRLFGPESMGGYGDLGAKVDAEAARLGITSEEVGDKIYREATGKIIKLPGVPEMYDWEFFAQPMPFDAVVTPIMRTVPTLLKGCDGVLAVNAHSWENEAIVGMKQWLGEWNKDVYAIGPLLPYGYGNLQQSNRGANDIQHFLDNIKVKYGEGSALLLSLGTMFWPKDTGYLEEIVEALLESDFPFILSCASPFANLREELKQKVQASGIGFITTWCPQQFILSHSATGWFLTHCGHNSVTEALGSGMPIIAWPFAADQPATAAQLSELGLGIELLEVRSGEYGTKPLRRNGKAASGNREAVGKEIREVINMCRGSKGAQMRQNAQRVKLNLQMAWDANGPATRELNLFLERFMI